MKAIHILTPDLDMVGEISVYRSLRIRRQFRGVGDFELVLPLSYPMADRLAQDQVLCPVTAPHKAMLVEEITKNEGADTLIVKGYTLSGLLRRRVCVPPAMSDATFGYDRIISDAESIMRHYVESNVTAPQSEARRMPCVALEEENLRRGMQGVPWSARFEQLDELLASVGTYCDAGFAIVPDFTRKKLVFTFLPGRDKTGADGSRVTFGVHMGNVSGTTATASAQQAKNAAIVGGAGEDENRLILSVSPGGETGLFRREMFVDAGSRSDPEELKAEGAHKLSDRAAVFSIRADVIDTPSCRYGETWELGDLVTVVARGAQMHARITQVQESHEAGRPVRIEATFGDPPGGIEKVVKDRTNMTVR